jgi:hypothetical protein
LENAKANMFPSLQNGFTLSHNKIFLPTGQTFVAHLFWEDVFFWGKLGIIQLVQNFQVWKISTLFTLYCHLGANQVGHLKILNLKVVMSWMSPDCKL